MSAYLKIQQPLFNVLHIAFSVSIVILLTILSVRIFRRWYRLNTTPSAPGAGLAQYRFLQQLITALIYLCGFSVAIYMIPPMRNLSLSVFASSGLLAVVIGFAAQHSIANIVGGIFITLFKPFVIGNRIKMLGKEITGTVEDITLRHTIIRTFENKRVIIPNSIMTTELIENSHLIDERICKFVEIGISYDSDIDRARTIMQEEAMKHPDMIDGRDREEKAAGIPVVVVRVVGFGDSSVNLRAWVWTRDQPTAFRMGCDLHEQIKRRFDQEGIEIPFPHRTIIYKKSAE